MKKKSSRAALELPVSVNEVIELSIVGLAHEGEGVGRYEGFTLFVPGALPGEKVRARVSELKKQYGRADLLAVLEASADRAAPPCAVYSQCGGCQLQHYAYEAQLRWKRQLVVDALERIGKLQVVPAPELASGEASQSPAAAASTAQPPVPASSESASSAAAVDAPPGSAAASDSDSLPVSVPAPKLAPDSASGSASAGSVLDQPGPVASGSAPVSGGPGGQRAPFAPYSLDSGVVVHPVIGMDEPWRYRNKAQVPIGFDLEEGGLVGGFYAQGSHRIVNMNECLIQHERNDEAILKVKAIAQELGIEAYDAKSRTGWLRHVVVKMSFASGDMMVVLVGTSRNVAGLDTFVSRIRSELAHVVSIALNVNPERTSAVFGRETFTLWGVDVIFDVIGGIRFAISARSFYQVNPVQTEVLYRTALEYADLTGDETVIDAYCGIGTISLFLARAARQVYGVELIPDAIEDARANSRLNGIDNADFTVGRAEAVIPAWRAEGIDADVIVVDPPRKGCDPALLETIIAMRPRRVVYVSCNPATLARDLRLLEDGGFRTVEVQPVDMFPHTGHVECVIGMQRIDT